MNDAALNSLSDNLLDTLRCQPIRSYPASQLATLHNCCPADILFAVDLLRRSGYDIKSGREERFRFISAPDLLLAAEITHRLTTSFVGRTVYAYNSVQSTNSVAGKLAEAKAPDGAVVVAESQTKGRGRMARPWYSPEQAGIYLSIILYPEINPADAPGLSIITSLALADTLAGYDPSEISIKWPNDCLLGGRKTAGILTELSADLISVHHVIVGVGVNLNQRRTDFPPEIRRTATSLRAETKTEIRRVRFLRRFLKQFENNYQRFCRSGLKPFRRRILKYSSLLGKNIKLDMQGTIIAGKAVDIDRNGNLVLETSTGCRTFSAGEVTVVKNHRR
ncbi:MAG: biotin--[acetyl-CoA-carboxylase] ligase [FCB group bacterium]|nr:biotin--[acetyl-CoA-carboxylase] ligase [FCB group bacterium]